MKWLMTIALMLGIYACNQTGAVTPLSAISDTVFSPHPGFSFTNGVAMFNSQPFTGIAIQQNANNTAQTITPYFQGKEDGIVKTFFPDGKKESERYFSNGEKDSLHQGWWPNGNLRFQYHFKQGKYDGLFAEWYANGAKAKEIEYANGQERKGIGWRENGKVYMSFAYKNGRRYGLVNARLCYSLQKENGEFEKSVAE